MIKFGNLTKQNAVQQSQTKEVSEQKTEAAKDDTASIMKPSNSQVQADSVVKNLPEFAEVNDMTKKASANLKSMLAAYEEEDAANAGGFIPSMPLPKTEENHENVPSKKPFMPPESGVQK